MSGCLHMGKIYYLSIDLSKRLVLLCVDYSGTYKRSEIIARLRMYFMSWSPLKIKLEPFITNRNRILVTVGMQSGADALELFYLLEKRKI